MSESGYYPGCHLPSSGKKKSHQICEHLREMLETRATFDNLHKELERREHRNEALMKELHHVRQLHRESQAELRTLKSTFDKVYHERKALSSELGDSKEYCYKLEIQISRMENSGQLLTESETLKAEVYRLQQLLEQKQIDVEVSEQKYKQLEQEKSGLAHSLEAALSYQQHSKGRTTLMDLASLSPSSASSPVPLSSEKMRNIYHELGKRQSDIHALSLALAQTTAEKKAILEEQGGLRGTIKAQSEEIRRLQIEKERVMEASIHDADEKAYLENQIQSLREEAKKFQEEVETLARDLTESRVELQEYREEKEAEVEVLTEEVIKLENDRKTLQDRVESLSLSFRHRESVHAMTEQRLQSETMKLVKEREALQSTLSEGATASSQLEMLRINLSNALKANESLAKESRELTERSRSELQEKRFENEKSEAKVRALMSENQKLKDEMDDLVREREEAAAALRKSIQLARGLTQRVSEEKEQREELERLLVQEKDKLQAILKAKEQVSNAMLDALHRERALQSSLSRSFSLRSGEETPRSPPISVRGGGTPVDSSPRPTGALAAVAAAAGRGTVSGISPHPLLSHSLDHGRSPVMRLPLDDRDRYSRDLSPSASASESFSSATSVPSAAIPRSTIVLSDNSPPPATAATAAAASIGPGPSQRRVPQVPSHDFFLTQLLSPSTPAPSPNAAVPPLPIPQPQRQREPQGQGQQQPHAQAPMTRGSLVNDLTRLKQEVEALDQQSRAASKFSVRDQQQRTQTQTQHRRGTGAQELQQQDEDSSSCGSNALLNNHLDLDEETSSVSLSEDHDPQQQRGRALSFPSDSSATSSFIEPLQESPLRRGSAVGRSGMQQGQGQGQSEREAYRISPRYPSTSSLAHLTSNTQTTLLENHDRQSQNYRAARGTGSGAGTGTGEDSRMGVVMGGRGETEAAEGNDATGAHSLFDIMTMDFASSSADNHES